MEDPLLSPSIITNAFTSNASVTTEHVSVNHLTWTGGNIEGNLVSSIVYVQHPVTQQFQASTLTFDTPYVQGPSFQILNGEQTWTLLADAQASGNTLVARDAAGHVRGADMFANVFRGNVASASGTIDHLITQDVVGNLMGNVVEVSANVSSPLFVGNVMVLDSYVECPLVHANVVGDSVEAPSIVGNVTGDVEGNLVGEYVSVQNAVAKENLTTGTVTSDVALVDQIQCHGIVFDGATGNLTGNVQGSVFGALHGDVHGNVTGNLEGTVTGNLVGHVSGDVIGNVTGDVFGNVAGEVSGNVTGNVAGHLTGDVTGDVTGNVLGNLAGNVTGNLIGDVWGALNGNVTGNVTGDVTGNVLGNVTGNLTGDVVGNVTGDTTGNVTGNVLGNVIGNLQGNVHATNADLHLGTQTFHEIVFETNGIPRIQVAVNGGVGIGTNYVPDTFFALDVNGRIRATDEITAFSDRRVKRAIEPLTHAWDKLRDLQGVSFERTDAPTRGRSIGLVAQDVERIVPEVVCTDGSKDGYKSIAYGNLIALVIEAVKELETRYETKIHALEQTVEACQRALCGDGKTA